MISIIIPLYNKEKSIINTLDSVKNQIFNEFEIIIVNDGSTDNSLTLVNQFSDPRIKVINQSNKGVSNARNTGIKNSKYNLIALLDGDDVWDSTFLNEMFKLAQLFPEASLFGCASNLKWPNGKLNDTTFGLEKDFKGYVNNYFSIACQNTLYNSSSVLFRKNDFIEIGMFDENLSKGEDIDLWIRFALNKKIAFYNKPLTNYHLDADQRAGNRQINKSKSLIWNLSKFNKYNNKQLNIFLEHWRLAHISNYLNNSSTEVDEPFELLDQIKEIKLSKFYKILKVLPKSIHIPFYKFWTVIKNV